MQCRAILQPVKGECDMKRTAAFIAALALAISLAGCGSSRPEDNGLALAADGDADRMPRCVVSL